MLFEKLINKSIIIPCQHSDSIENVSVCCKILRPIIRFSIITITFTGLLKSGNTHLRCSKSWHYYAGGVSSCDSDFDKIKLTRHWVGPTSKNSLNSRVIPHYYAACLQQNNKYFQMLVLFVLFLKLMNHQKKIFYFCKPV